MNIKINEFRLYPRDGFDGRRMSFTSKLLNNEDLIGSSIINIAITGSIFPAWLEMLPQNPTNINLGK